MSYSIKKNYLRTVCLQSTDIILSNSTIITFYNEYYSDKVK